MATDRATWELPHNYLHVGKRKRLFKAYELNGWSEERKVPIASAELRAVDESGGLFSLAKHFLENMDGLVFSQGIPNKPLHIDSGYCGNQLEFMEAFKESMGLAGVIIGHQSGLYIALAEDGKVYQESKDWGKIDMVYVDPAASMYACMFLFPLPRNFGIDFHCRCG